MMSDANVMGSRMLTLPERVNCGQPAVVRRDVSTRVTNAPNRARDTNAAEPMAKPCGGEGGEGEASTHTHRHRHTGEPNTGESSQKPNNASQTSHTRRHTRAKMVQQ